MGDLCEAWREPDLVLRCIGALIVPDTLRGRASRVGSRVEGLKATILLLQIPISITKDGQLNDETHGTPDVVEIPDFLEDSAIVTTAEVRNGTGLRGQSVLELAKAVGSLVGGNDAVRRKHIERGELLEGTNGCEVEVDDILVLYVIGTITCNIERGCARCVLGELMGPEINVGAALVDPVLIHWEIRAISLSVKIIDNRCGITYSSQGGQSDRKPR